MESNQSITISLDQQGVNSNQTPTIYIAQVIIHEALHANMYLAIYNYNNGNTANMPDIDDFPGIYEQYREMKGWQHEFMADHYIDLIAQTLQDIHPLLNDQSFIDNYNAQDYPNWSWDDFYTNLAWLGLHNTNAFDEYSENNGTAYSFYNYETQTNSTKTPNCD